MSSSSRSQDDDKQTMPVYHLNHSYLFTKIVERHPGLTKDELEKEFKSNVEGAYVTELLDEYGAFYQNSRHQVAAFKEFVADEMIWRRYLCDNHEEKPEGKPEVGLSLDQGRDLIAKFQAMISKLKVELAVEKQKVEDADCFGKFTQQYVSQAMQEAMELRAEKKRLEEDLKEKHDVQVRKCEVLLAEKTNLEKKVKTKEKIEDLEDEVAELQQDNAQLLKDTAELEKAFDAHTDRMMSLEEGISLYDQVLRDRARLGQYGNQDGSDL